MDILIKPILTEKATNESEARNTYTFIVSKDANKVEIKKKQLNPLTGYLLRKLEP